MNSKLKLPAIGLFLTFGITFSLSQNTENPDFLILEELVETVTSPNVEAEESPSVSIVEEELPKEITDIVSEFYSEALVSDSVAAEVLGFLTDIYSEHGYHEHGYWGQRFSRRKNAEPGYYHYVPYSGTLPDYDNQDFQHPIEGRLTSGFGYRPAFGRFHKGIDLSLQYGDTVRCVLPGIVTKTGYQPGGYGKYVVVSHAGHLETLYGHLDTRLVSAGMKLEAGQPIGLGGATGNATGPHLHFETRYYGRPADPSKWF